MSDEADNANEHIEREESQSIKAVREKVLLQPVGVPGDCDLCGEYMVRLVAGACGFCRDRYKLP